MGKGGGGGGGQPTSTTAYQTNLPEYAKPYVMNMLGAAQNQLFTTKPGVDGQPGEITGFRPYQPYSTDPTKYFAGPSGLQQQVYGEAAGMQTPGQFAPATGLAGASGMGQLGTAQQARGLGQQGVGIGQMGMAAAAPAFGAGQQFMQGVTDPSRVGQFMSPYQQQVTDIAKAAAIRDAQMMEQGNRLAAARQGTYGGARQALASLERERNLATNLANIQAQGSQSAYDRALAQMQFGSNLGLQGIQTGLQGIQQGLAGTAQGLQGVGAQQAGYAGAGQAASTLGQLGGAQQQADLARMGFQQQTGAAQQQYQQNIINQAIQDYATAQQYPLMQLSAMSSLLRGLPLQSATTQTYQAAPSVTSQLAGLGTAGIGAYGLGRATGIFKEGGQVKGYKYGGLIPPEKLRAMADGLTKDQLEAQLRDPTLDDIERQIFTAELREKSRGLGVVPAQNMENLAGGGIVAFAEGDLVDDEEDDDSIGVGYAGQDDDAELMDDILARGIPAGAYGRGLAAVPAIGMNAAAPTGQGIRPEARAPRGLDADTFVQKIMARESGGRRYDKEGKLLTSSKGAEGEMQVMPKTQRDPGFGVRPARDDSPDEIARVGRDYATMLLARYEDPKVAAIAYNWGPGNTDKWLAQGADMSKLPKETQKYIRNLKAGGPIAFKNKGQVEDDEDDTNFMDYAALGIAAPDIIRAGSRVVRGVPSVPSGALSGTGTAAARTLGSVGAAGATAGVPSVLGYGGYKLSQGATRTLARPEAAEFRKGLTENDMLSAMSGDTGFASAILDQAVGKKQRGPMYMSADDVARENAKLANKGDPSKAQTDKQFVEMRKPPEQRAQEAENAKLFEQALGDASGATQPVSDSASKIEDMLLRREQALEKQGKIDSYLSLIMAGLGAAGGTSKNALENIAKGAQLGLGTYMTGAKQRAAGENAVMSGRLGLERLRGLQDIRQQQMIANQAAKVDALIERREKQLSTEAFNSISKLGLVIDSDEGRAALAKEVNRLRSQDPLLAKLYRQSGLPPIQSTGVGTPKRSPEDIKKQYNIS